MIPHLYDRDIQLDKDKLTKHCKDMLDDIGRIKPMFDAVREDDYIKRGIHSAGKLCHRIDRLRDAAGSLTCLHCGISNIKHNAGKYHERPCEDGLHVVKPDQFYGDIYEKITDHIDNVRRHADEFMDSLP